MAVDRRTRCLDANNRPDVVAVISDMPDDDLGVVVGRDHRRGAGTRVILARPDDPVGEGPIVLLEPGALRGKGREGRPRTVFEEGALHADKVRRGDRLGYRRGRDERGEETAQK